MQKRFHYVADIQQIPSIRKDLSILADRWQLPGSIFNQVSFIIEELFSNIVRHGYQDTGSHLVEVIVKLEFSYRRSGHKNQLEITKKIKSNRN